MAKSIAVRASQSVPFFFSARPVFFFTVIYGALSFPEGIASGESASTVGCCRLLSSASISCCRLHRLLWAAPSTCPITARALGTGLWPLWLSLGPSLGNLPSEISTEALARDRMWWSLPLRCSLPLAVLLPLRRACRSPSDAAVSKFPLLHRSRVHLRLSSSVLAVHLHFARAWFFDIAERQCFAPRDGIRLHAARHVARRASLPAPRPRSGSLRLLHLRLRAWCRT